MQENYDFSKVERHDEFYTTFMGDLPYDIDRIPKEKDPSRLRKLLESIIAGMKETLSKIRAAANNRPELEGSLRDLNVRVEGNVAALEQSLENI